MHVIVYQNYFNMNSFIALYFYELINDTNSNQCLLLLSIHNAVWSYKELSSLTDLNLYHLFNLLLGEFTLILLHTLFRIGYHVFVTWSSRMWLPLSVMIWPSPTFRRLSMFHPGDYDDQARVHGDWMPFARPHLLPASVRMSWRHIHMGYTHRLGCLWHLSHSVCPLAFPREISAPREVQVHDLSFTRPCDVRVTWLCHMTCFS